MRYVESRLYDIRGINRVILSLAIFTLVLTAAVAGLIPARSAAAPARNGVQGTSFASTFMTTLIAYL